MSYLAIVAKGDVPIFEAKLPSATPIRAQPDNPNQFQFIVHQSLDSVDQKKWSGTSMYLKEVDRFNNIPVSAFVTSGHIRFMLLHPGKDDSSVRSFFYDLYEMYVKIAMNPFYIKNTPITNRKFEVRVMALAKTHFSRR